MRLANLYDKHIDFADDELMKITFLYKTGSLSGMRNRAPSEHAQLIEDHFETYDDVIKCVGGP